MSDKRPIRIERPPRPAGLDYRRDLMKRFEGSKRTHLLNLAYVDVAQNVQRKPYAVQDRIALIDITGVLCNEPSWWDETGYDEIRSEVAFALEDGDIDAILLRVNSPGGETTNAFETADFLKTAGAAKPIWAVASPIAYSAAYLMIANTGKIYLPPISGGVGSIGVYALHLSFAGMLEKEGIEATFISAGEGKVDGNPFEKLSARARAEWKTEIDRLYTEFVSRVAVGRSLAESAIIKFGAATFEGSKAALGVGLADRAGSDETAWLDLADKMVRARSSAASGAQQLKGEPMAIAAQPLESNPAAVTPPAAAAPAPPAAAAAIAVPALSWEEASEIVQICTLAGKLELIAGFMDANKTAKEVRAALLNQLADHADKPGLIHTGVLPHDAADAGKPAKSLATMMMERFKGKGKEVR